jgi:hypothetical protein
LHQAGLTPDVVAKRNAATAQRHERSIPAP